MASTLAERPVLSLRMAFARTGLLRRPAPPPEPRYLVIPEHAWLNQKPATNLGFADEEFPARGGDWPTEDDYYHRHLEPAPMSHATVSTLGGLCTSVVSGALPGILIGVPGGIVAGVAAGLFGGLIGRELVGEFLDRRHDA